MNESKLKTCSTCEKKLSSSKFSTKSKCHGCPNKRICDDCKENDDVACTDCKILFCHGCWCDQTTAESKEYFHFLDDQHFSLWKDFKDVEGKCSECWCKAAANILLNFRNSLQGIKYIIENQTCNWSKCGKIVPEKGISFDSGGTFFRSECYSCNPLQTNEIEQKLCPLDRLLKHRDLDPTLSLEEMSKSVSIKNKTLEKLGLWLDETTKKVASEQLFVGVAPQQTRSSSSLEETGKKVKIEEVSKKRKYDEMEAKIRDNIEEFFSDHKESEDRGRALKYLKKQTKYALVADDYF